MAPRGSLVSPAGRSHAVYMSLRIQTSRYSGSISLHELQQVLTMKEANF